MKNFEEVIKEFVELKTNGYGEKFYVLKKPYRVKTINLETFGTSESTSKFKIRNKKPQAFAMPVISPDGETHESIVAAAKNTGQPYSRVRKYCMEKLYGWRFKDDIR